MTFRKPSRCQNSECVEVDLDWHTARASQNNGGCVEVAWHQACGGNGSCVGVAWEKPSASFANGDSVEVRQGGCPDVHVRDSKDPDGIILDYPRSIWGDGLAVEFEPVSKSLVPPARVRARDRKAAEGDRAARDHWYQVSRGGRSLWFDQAELDAFRLGVADREFTLA